jgi:hypothetical protein
VAVPVDADVRGADRLEHRAREADELADALGRDVADGVAQAQPRDTVLDCRAEQAIEDRRWCARGVLGDERHRQPVAPAQIRRHRRALEE